MGKLQAESCTYFLITKYGYIFAVFRNNHTKYSVLIIPLTLLCLDVCSREIKTQQQSNG